MKRPLTGVNLKRVVNVSATNLERNVDDLLKPGSKKSFNNNRLLVTSEEKPNEELSEKHLFRVLDK